MYMHNKLLIVQMYNTFQQKTLYIHDLQYTRNTVIIKDWTYDEINPHAKRFKKIFYQNASFKMKAIVCSGRNQVSKMIIVFVGSR